ENPFVVQNCSAFSETLLESELFGHVKGAYTGAHSAKRGLFEVADNGTFFLDELGEMPPSLQAKLLRVLQDGTFMPVGDTREKKVDVRIVAATNKDLNELIKEGKFREDLYYRICGVRIHLPPLRERKEDIPVLVEHFLKSLPSDKPKRFSEGAMALLMNYHWPGNVRQLENEVARAMVLSGSCEVIEADVLSPEIQGEIHTDSRRQTSFEGRLKDAVESLERDMIEAALSKAGGNKSEAARILGISRSNLISKVQQYGLG
ncbi:MAG: sigma-54-dependent Fis family transcriptional regulator, partial [Candidatus Dadabacteria bacterium]